MFNWQIVDITRDFIATLSVEVIVVLALLFVYNAVKRLDVYRQESFAAGARSAVYTEWRRSLLLMKLFLRKLTKYSSGLQKRFIAIIIFSYLLFVMVNLIWKYLCTLVAVVAACFLVSSMQIQFELGSALAWSYYLGYLKRRLQVLSKSNLMWKTSSNEVKEIVALFLLIPKNCEIVNEFTDKKERLEFLGEYGTEQRNVGLNMKRTFKNSVYEVRGSTEDTSFCCLVEYATPTAHLKTMSDPSLRYFMQTGLTNAEMLYQLQLFRATLEDILATFAYEFLPAEDESAEARIKFQNFFHLVEVDGNGSAIAQAIIEKRWNIPTLTHVMVNPPSSTASEQLDQSSTQDEPTSNDITNSKLVS